MAKNHRKSVHTKGLLERVEEKNKNLYCPTHGEKAVMRMETRGVEVKIESCCCADHRKTVEALIKKVHTQYLFEQASLLKGR
jgi:hypothetical protein